MKKNVSNCPLCLSVRNFLFSQDGLRDYLRCQVCDLVFVPRDQLISSLKEKERYQHHQNFDDCYKTYLNRTVLKTLPFIKSGSIGLDFGCGPTTLLSELYSSHQIEVDSYDFYFFKDQNIWQKSFDFIILSEVIEHLRDPIHILRDLRGLINFGGSLFVKTNFLPLKDEKFNDWFYKRDLTHVQFFNSNSMNFLKTDLGFLFVENLGEDLYFLHSSKLHRDKIIGHI